MQFAIEGLELAYISTGAGIRRGHKVNLYMVLLLLFVAGFAKAEGLPAPKIINITTEEYLPYTSKTLLDYGIDCHIVSEAFRLEGIEVKYSFYPGARSYKMAQKGEVDATLPWAKRIGREKYFYYSDPIIKVDKEHFFFRKGFTFSWDPVIQDYHAIKGTPVGAIIAYNYGKKFQDAEKQGIIETHRVSGQEQLFRMLLAGRIDLVISKAQVAQNILQTHFSTEEANQIELRPENSKKPGYDYLLISKQKPNARYYMNAFNSGLEKLHANGQYQMFIEAFLKGEYDMQRGL